MKALTYFFITLESIEEKPGVNLVKCGVFLDEQLLFLPGNLNPFSSYGSIFIVLSVIIGGDSFCIINFSIVISGYYGFSIFSLLLLALLLVECFFMNLMTPMDSGTVCNTDLLSILLEVIFNDGCLS